MDTTVPYCFGHTLPIERGPYACRPSQPGDQVSIERGDSPGLKHATACAQDGRPGSLDLSVNE